MGGAAVGRAHQMLLATSSNTLRPLLLELNDDILCHGSICQPLQRPRTSQILLATSSYAYRTRVS